MKINPIQTAFRVAGLVTSAASVWGTYGFLIHETNNDRLLSAAGAVGLSIAIYAGWDILFNHKSWSHKIPAALIGLLGAAASTWTIYEYVQLPDTLAQQEKVGQALESAKQQRLAEYQQKRDKADADRKLIKSQQDALKAESRTLTEQNTADQANIQEREAQIKKGIRPNGNNAAIRATRADMEKRQSRIIEIQQSLLDLTRQYTAIKDPVLEATLTPPTNNDDQQSSLLAEALAHPATLIRASLYEIMTLLFLLFGALYRRQQDSTDHDQAQMLKDSIAAAATQIESITALLNDLDAASAQAASTTAQVAEQKTETLQATAAAHKNLTAITQAAQKLLQQTSAATQSLQHQLGTNLAQQKTIQPLLKEGSDLVSTLQNSFAEANELINDLQTANLRCNKAIATANDTIAGAFAPANSPANPSKSSAPEKLTETEALNLLKERKIEPSPTGMITTDIIKEATGWGRTKAEKLIIKAYEQVFLERETYGRGWAYFYPAIAEQTTHSQTNNVVHLRG